MIGIPTNILKISDLKQCQFFIKMTYKLTLIPFCICFKITRFSTPITTDKITVFSHSISVIAQILGVNLMNCAHVYLFLD